MNSKCDFGSLSRLAFDIHGTAGLVHEAVDLTETEAATGADLLCRYKGIKDPG